MDNNMATVLRNFVEELYSYAITDQDRAFTKKVEMAAKQYVENHEGRK